MTNVPTIFKDRPKVVPLSSPFEGRTLVTGTNCLSPDVMT